MAIVNAFIVTKETQIANNDPPTSHADFLMTLQEELLSLRDDDFAANAILDDSDDDDEEPIVFLPNPKASTHIICQTQDRVASGAKRRTRVCKVCSLLSEHGERRHETTFFCVQCTGDKKGE